MDANHHHHQHTNGHAGTDAAAAANGESNAAASPSPSTSNTSSLDHALLESLFYNEMMLMEDESSAGSILLSTLAADGTPTTVDPSTLAEKALLHDFGVSSFEQQEATATATSTAVASKQAPVAAKQAPLTATAVVARTEVAPPQQPPPPVAVAQAAVAHAAAPTVVTVDPVATAAAAAAAATVVSVPTPSSPPAGVSVTANHPVAYHAAGSTTASTAAVAAVPRPTTAAAAASPTATATTNNPENNLEEKRTKLVSQFATLASRLGINLPPHIVQSLAKAAATNASGNSTPAAADPQQQQPNNAPAPVAPPVAQCSSTRSVPATATAVPAAARGVGITLPPPPPASSSTAAAAPLAVPSTAAAAAAASATTTAALPTVASTTATASLLPPPRQVQELQSTAEAAIAAATASTTTTASRKRGGAPADADTTTSTTTTKPAAYTKRRKKPRLQDCASRLAELKTENAMLKQHLHTVTHQTHQLNQEQRSTELRLRQMWTNASATDAEMDAVVKHYTDQYSDYGRRRHQELNFHLEQLERLANLTPFVKMGLWTMGQQGRQENRNPLAGMLQKELGITPQQGRKILEQREKIRNVSANLAECHKLLAKLKSLCEQKTQIFSHRLSKCREILTPRQVVKLILWIDDHSETLGNVCPGWGSEQIRST